MDCLEDIHHALFMSDNKRALWNEAMSMYMATCRPANSPPAVVVECEKDEKGNPKGQP